MIEQTEIEKALPVAEAAIMRCGVSSQIKLLRVPKREDKEGGFSQVVAFSAVVSKDDYSDNIEFWVPLPRPGHRTEKVWAWVIAHFLAGYIYRSMRDLDFNEQAIVFYGQASDAVHELATKESN